MTSSDQPSRSYVSRGGQKLSGALDAFNLDVAGLRCADLGCNVGGFTDYLLQHGAEHVWAVDTGYGDFAWTLRNDPRVTLHERTNALHFTPPAAVDLAVVDVSWTPQQRIVPAAIEWLDAGSNFPAGRGGGAIVSLLKPHYEYAKIHGRKLYRPLTEDESADVLARVREQLTQLGAEVLDSTPCAIRGKGGNREYLLLLTPR
jgi:23S rRNA (cytidine1920-2'-O)/16S rRNA (cytidine1409-2'-O)-methyltransferase